MVVHALKVWPEYYTQLALGVKGSEVRRKDREYRVGDLLSLREWDPVTKVGTGRVITRRITLVLDLAPIGIPGYVELQLGGEP